MKESSWVLEKALADPYTYFALIRGIGWVKFESLSARNGELSAEQASEGGSHTPADELLLTLNVKGGRVTLKNVHFLNTGIHGAIESDMIIRSVADSCRGMEVRIKDIIALVDCSS